jgi:uncharacterized protein (UPF0335 family)
MSDHDDEPPFDPSAIVGKGQKPLEPVDLAAARAKRGAGKKDGKPKGAAGKVPMREDGKPAGNVAADRLRSFVERIERLEDEKKGIAGDIKDVYGEAKANGYDTKSLRRIIALRKQDMAERLEFEAVVDTYLAALGMLPLFDDDGVSQ